MEAVATTRTRRVVGGKRSRLDLTPSTSGLIPMVTFTLLSLLLLINSFASLAAAQTTPIPVVGVKTGVDSNTGQRPIRRNINDLYARGGPQWDLYILALSEMQAMDESEELSYFSLAGIHGLPHRVWNGVEQVEGAPEIGYCPHGETIFVPWHRPYVALFESPTPSPSPPATPPSLQPAYTDAARTLRLPFWDWASDPSLPYAVMNDTIKVSNTPNSSLASLSPPNSNGTGGGSGAPSGAAGVKVRNPLYSYRFQEGSVMYGFSPDNMRLNPQTERCVFDEKGPDNKTEIRRWSEPWVAEEGMKELGSQLRDGVYDIFVRPDAGGWGAMWFEGPHNTVHNNAGCNSGTLANIDWSAFDPLFMLHHANTDRLVALWQAIYYHDTTFNYSFPSGGQLGTKKGTILTADSPLKPFHAEFPANSSGSGNTAPPPSDAGGFFHTSNSVADLRTFGYTYPELNTDWQTPDKEKLAAQVRKAVNKLYGSKDDGSADEQGQAGGVSGRDVDEDHLEEELDEEEEDDIETDGGKGVEENNKITFRRSRSRSLSPSTSKEDNHDKTTSNDAEQTEENNKITFRHSRPLTKSLSSARSNPSSKSQNQKRQSYGQPPTKNYYYTAELSVNRSEVPLPCTISLIVNGVVMGRMSLLGMPMEGIAKASMPLGRPLDDVVKKNGVQQQQGSQNQRRELDTGGGNQIVGPERKGRWPARSSGLANGGGGGGGGGQKQRREMMAAAKKTKRGLGHVDMTPKKIIPFLRGNMTVEIRSNDQTLTDPSTVPSLHLDIQDWEYTPRKNASEFPIFQNPRKWPMGIRGPGGGHGGYGGGGGGH
ncbi:hypothetical protein B0H65DRAFT_576876 [Neurospora tetraspora]|uniref:Tyrosinase copper-binding domain-containing protein n=1 Tax=Neurospora tetraspora TaxID=94610 RepID=A0AAE0JEM3_9PEZI|nr:hypothetical protein B0H65DRAFT_576876 [Neurospora tetraspora]